MIGFLDKFRIPTILGLAVIVLGIAAGGFLVLRQQNITSQATPNLTPQNITLSNLSDDSVTISWQTPAIAVSFTSLGVKNADETVALDDRDNQSPKAHLLHYVTVKKLLPKTTYQYKIISGSFSSDTRSFTTAAPLSAQTNLNPIIGSVLDGQKSLQEGIAYLSMADATIQSALIKDGNFLIPLSQIRKADLTDGFSPNEDTIAKLTVLSPNGQASMLFKLKNFNQSLPQLILGQNLDLTTQSPAPNQDITQYDLNGDGKINTLDYNVVLQNFGKKGPNLKGDLNSDGVVDQKDLDLMTKKLNQINQTNQ